MRLLIEGECCFDDDAIDDDDRQNFVSREESNECQCNAESADECWWRRDARLFFIDHLYSLPRVLVFFNAPINSLSFILVPQLHIILFVGALCTSSALADVMLAKQVWVSEKWRGRQLEPSCL